MNNDTKVIFFVSLSLAFFIAKSWSMDPPFYKTEKTENVAEGQQAEEHQREREMTEDGEGQQSECGAALPSQDIDSNRDSEQLRGQYAAALPAASMTLAPTRTKEEEALLKAKEVAAAVRQILLSHNRPPLASLVPERNLLDQVMQSRNLVEIEEAARKTLEQLDQGKASTRQTLNDLETAIQKTERLVENVRLAPSAQQEQLKPQVNKTLQALSRSSEEAKKAAANIRVEDVPYKYDPSWPEIAWTVDKLLWKFEEPIRDNSSYYTKSNFFCSSIEVTRALSVEASKLYLISELLTSKAEEALVAFTADAATIAGDINKEHIAALGKLIVLLRGAAQEHRMAALEIARSFRQPDQTLLAYRKEWLVAHGGYSFCFYESEPSSKERNLFESGKESEMFLPEHVRLGSKMSHDALRVYLRNKNAYQGRAFSTTSIESKLAATRAKEKSDFYYQARTDAFIQECASLDWPAVFHEPTISEKEAYRAALLSQAQKQLLGRALLQEAIPSRENVMRVIEKGRKTAQAAWEVAEAISCNVYELDIHDLFFYKNVDLFLKKCESKILAKIALEAAAELEESITRAQPHDTIKTLVEQQILTSATSMLIKKTSFLKAPKFWINVEFIISDLQRNLENIKNNLSENEKIKIEEATALIATVPELPDSIDLIPDATALNQQMPQEDVPWTKIDPLLAWNKAMNIHRTAQDVKKIQEALLIVMRIEKEALQLISNTDLTSPIPSEELKNAIGAVGPSMQLMRSLIAALADGVSPAQRATVENMKASIFDATKIVAIAGHLSERMNETRSSLEDDVVGELSQICTKTTGDALEAFSLAEEMTKKYLDVSNNTAPVFQLGDQPSFLPDRFKADARRFRRIFQETETAAQQIQEKLQELQRDRNAFEAILRRNGIESESDSDDD